MLEKFTPKEKFNDSQIEKLEELKELKRFIFKKTTENKDFDALSRIAQPFEEKNPEAKKCYLYHTLIGSSINPDQCDSFDLEGDKSILELAKKIKKELEK